MNSIQTMRADFAKNLSSLKEEINKANPSFEDVVSTAHALWDISEMAGGLLDILKPEIRNKAASVLGDPTGNISFPVQGVSNGSCMVTFVGPSLKVKKGADMAKLKEALGAEFSIYFEEKVSYDVKPQFENNMIKLASDNSEKLKTVMSVVDQVSNTPRISFKNR